MYQVCTVHTLSKCILFNTLSVFFLEEKILHLNPEQEKDKTYSIDSEVLIQYIIILAEILHLSVCFIFFFWFFGFFFCIRPVEIRSLSLIWTEKHKGLQGSAVENYPRQTIVNRLKQNTYIDDNSSQPFALLCSLSCTDRSRIGVDRKTSSLGVAGKQL